MRELGVTPLTWAFVKVLGRQLRDNVRDWDGLPNSHAWAAAPQARPQQLLTKAQCMGVVVSIHQRAERVELLIDDGTALVRAVLWSPTWDEGIKLGDLVHVSGKLNMDSSWSSENKATDAPVRELRIVRIHMITDPNEELLHWMDVAELSATVYGSGKDVPTTATDKTAPPARSPATIWDTIVSRAFHELDVNDSEVSAFLSRPTPSPHDRVLISTVRGLVEAQRTHATTDSELTSDGRGGDRVLRFSFPDLLHDALAKEGVTAADALHHATTRSLRHAFAMLRSAGLVHLEDTESDRYAFITAEFVLAPALLEFLQNRSGSVSIGAIAQWVLTQERFKRVSISSLESTLHRLVTAGRLDQRHEGSERFFSCRDVSTT